MPNPRLLVDGWDGSDLSTRVRSFSRGNVWHDQLTNLEDGRVICSCEAHEFNTARGGNVYKGSCGCVHARLLTARLTALMADPKLPPYVLASMIDDRFQGSDPRSLNR